MVLFGGDFQPRDGGLDVRFGLLQKDAGQLERGLGMTLTGGLLQQRQCLPVVGRILRQQLVCLPERESDAALAMIGNGRLKFQIIPSL